MRRLVSILFATAVLCLPAVSNVQAASDYPNRAVRLVVGFGPGGATDSLARLLSGALSKELGQSVYVENIAGASGLLGWRTVANASPDGYTLLMAENAVVIRPGFKDMQPAFDPVQEFDAVAAVAHAPLAVCLANKVPANSMQELIALSKSSANKLNIASAGLSSVSQLVWEVVADGAKINGVNVPYRGGGPAMAALVAQQVDVTMPSSQVAAPMVEGKQIKCIAVTGTTRSTAMPQVPTLAEAGIKHAEVDLRFWFGVFGPKNMPADVKATLEKAIQRVLATPAIRERLAGFDVTPAYEPGSVLHARLETEIKNWKTFIEAKGLVAQ